MQAALAIYLLADHYAATVEQPNFCTTVDRAASSRVVHCHLSLHCDFLTHYFCRVEPALAG